jgi:hypothetical protein
LFARYLADAARRVGRLVVSVPDTLAPLLRVLPEVAAVVPTEGDAPAHDRWLPIPSLPLALGAEVGALGERVPYLEVPEAARARWRGRLGGGLRVGLTWFGNPQFTNNAVRSIPLRRLARLLDLPGMTFHCLQVGPPADELASVPGGAAVVRIDREIADLADTAAIIAELDLVISVCTSVANLAGALGRPLWALLAYSSDWRWQAELSQSPWYPTARRFRQPRPGDWDVVVEQVRSALTRLVAERERSGAPA